MSCIPYPMDHNMSGSVSTGRTPSLPTPPTEPSADPLDTALPPMSSKQLVPIRPSESSMILNNFRNSQRVSATFYSQDAMPMVAHGSSAHRRTGSTIKTVMRKIFTRKRRSNTDDFQSAGPGPRPGGFRYSNPTERMGHSLPRSVNVRRGSPLKEENETPQPDDFYHLQARPPRRRRATLPSLAFSDEEARATLDALASEPSHYRPNSSLAPPGDPARDRRRDLLRTRRRSRSADALRAVAAGHRMDPIQWRRRSVASAEYVGTTVSDSELSYRPPTGTTHASAPEESTAPSVYDTDESQPPADAHDDDDDDNNTNDNRNSIIVPCAGTLISAMQHDPDLSVDQRVATIEVKLIDLEFAIARMQTSPTPSSTDRARSTPRSRHAHSRRPSTSKHVAPGTSSGPPSQPTAPLPPLPPKTAPSAPQPSNPPHPTADTRARRPTAPPPQPPPRSLIPKASPSSSTAPSFSSSAASKTPAAPSNQSSPPSAKTSTSCSSTRACPTPAAPCPAVPPAPPPQARCTPSTAPSPASSCGCASEPSTHRAPRPRARNSASLLLPQGILAPTGTIRRISGGILRGTWIRGD
ncbi:hypothetical protein P168DRAFT_146495 [Aspergillus campestris IBT 28561]|uniref:Uncharacterized protein n=1 Tax=Aspergillus campestris (strain IBT 28561) TaxID=1392248 RepID=A0A2I1D5K3_ASPC2|nr:uncharacterized protein P168DRAFT_146495 [Aspergillus campestris IBT 28561]PKY05157.1 hypothetical protein P168DRAFT_146495 [Aspergillus campestris IBT 28561]